MRKRPAIVEVDRATLEAVARIFDGQCAAAQALADADSHDGPVRFYNTGSSILVEKLSRESVLVPKAPKPEGPHSAGGE